MMKGGLGNLMRQAQQMQETMQKAQAELAEIEVTGESGAGMVKVTLNGRHEAKKVVIEPKLLGEDKEMLEDLMVAAINDAAGGALAAQLEATSSPATRSSSEPCAVRISTGV